MRCPRPSATFAPTSTPPGSADPEQGYLRGRTPTILHASSQHISQVGQSHSISPSAPRGWVAPHRQRIDTPNGTVRSRRLIACRCPSSGNHKKGCDSGYGVATGDNNGAPSQCVAARLGDQGVGSEPGGTMSPFRRIPGGIPVPLGDSGNTMGEKRQPQVQHNRVSAEVRAVPLSSRYQTCEPGHPRQRPGYPRMPCAENVLSQLAGATMYHYA